MDQWVTVLFTDESRFSLKIDSRHSFIRREPGTRYLLFNVREIDNYGEGGLIRGLIEGRHHVGWPDACGPEFILMNDNAMPYRVLLVDEFLQSEDVHRMDWPARSSDLNSIQHVWDAVGRAIAARNRSPRTTQEKKTAFLNEWDQLSQ
ncbi:uncharacterized protein TNCV_1629331 [Trichonephila clavipes]|uniref:Tc1-like transposase DDE domain-containing protein n=1 Tax=Trichonephila clavipes TaxID=2585209 RepID=A0A8X7BGZ6_TRICX|nr:uncharacterized protein TNCV_1629331 [Trichonephila clavipes]